MHYKGNVCFEINDMVFINVDFNVNEQGYFLQVVNHPNRLYCMIQNKKSCKQHCMVSNVILTAELPNIVSSQLARGLCALNSHREGLTVNLL